MTTDTRKCYDLSEMRLMSRNNEPFVRQLAELFHAQTPKIVSEVLAAHTRGDLRGMADHAHKLKQSIFTMEIEDLKVPITSIVRVGREGTDGPELQSMLQKLDDTIKEVMAALESDFGFECPPNKKST